MEITLGQQYNVGEKPTVILYTDIISRHARTPEKQNRANVVPHQTWYYRRHPQIGVVGPARLKKTKKQKNKKIVFLVLSESPRTVV